MTLAQARALVAVAEARSFSEAALELGVSQAAVSSSIRELERDLGVRLLERGRFGARATAVGTSVVDQARAMVQAERTARQIAAQARGRVEGTVRVGVFHSVASYVLPAVIGELAHRYPGVRVEMVEPRDDTGEPVLEALAASVRRRQCEATFLQLPTGGAAAELDELLVWELFEDDYVAMVSPAYRAAHADRAFRMRDLLHAPLIANPDLPCGQRLLAHLRATVGSPANVLSVRDDVAITQMVEGGLGIGVLPRLSARSADATVELHPIEPRLTRTIAFATRPDALAAPAVRALLSVLGEGYPAARLPSMPHPAPVDAVA